MQEVKGLFPYVVVVFEVSDPKEPYHVGVHLGPQGYSVFRTY